MKRSLLVALVIALPVEALNMKFCEFPIDVGLPSNTSWHWNLLCDQWTLLHLLAFPTINWMDHHGLLSRLGYAVFFASGYVETVLLFAAAIFIFQRFRGAKAKFCRNPA